MANKQDTQAKSSKAVLPDAFAQLQDAGLSNFTGFGTAWMEALSDMGAEVAGFVADRIKEDVKTQHEMLHCKNVADLQHIQAKFIQKAMDQYQAETGRLVEMSTQAFAAKSTDEAP